jgi:hypothetical protein
VEIIPIRLVFVSAIGICALSVSRVSGATAIDAEWGYEEKALNGKTFNQITISPKASGGGPVHGAVAIVSASPDLIEVQKVGDTAKKPVTLVGPPSAKGDIVRLSPKDGPEKGAKYQIFVKTNAAGVPALQFIQSGAVVPYENPISVRVADTSSGIPDEHLNFDTKNLKFNTKGALGLLSGSTDSAILSGKATVNFGKVIADQFFLTSDVTADVELKGTNVKDYFNSVVADLRATEVFSDTHSGRFFIGHGQPELGLVNRFESDQSFATINETFGLGLWTSVDNSLTRAISDTVFVDGSQFAPGPSPYVVLSYDYVVKVATGTGSSAPATKTGNNRITTKLDWPLWIVRGWDLRATPLKNLYAISLLIDVTPIYDIEQSKVFVEEKISLEFKPDDPTDPKSKDKPALVLTLANGKATPTFKNVDALLAGIKLPW